MDVCFCKYNVYFVLRTVVLLTSQIIFSDDKLEFYREDNCYVCSTLCLKKGAVGYVIMTLLQFSTNYTIHPSLFEHKQCKCK